MSEALPTGEKRASTRLIIFTDLDGTLLDHESYCFDAATKALEGIPALYIHSLLATENDTDRVEHTGNNRSINRHIWQENDLQ